MNAEEQLEWVWTHCHVIHWPDSAPSGCRPYPIEHNLAARKNARSYIEAHMPVKQLVMTKEIAQLLFAVEAALPFVRLAVGDRSCSSSGGPVALSAILEHYGWSEQRDAWVMPPGFLAALDLKSAV